MAVIKYKTSDETKGDKGWVALYANAINNRLRKDLNLSDVANRAEARKNLELVGDNNTTHYHDSRYLPLIEKEANERKQADLQEKQDRQKAIEEEAKERERQASVLVNSEAQSRKDADNELRSLINKEVQDRINAINNLRVYVDTKTVFDSRGRLVFPNGNLLWIE